MKTIKIIDLLNMIANGMIAPKKLKYEGNIYEFKGEDYYCEETDSWLLTQDEYLFTGLNEEIEIVEESKLNKIEKINMTDTITNYILAGKLNEVIDELNEVIDKLNEASND